MICTSSEYPGIREYVSRTVESCKANGYVETVLGRRRYLPEISARRYYVRQAAERAAINMPIQGTAADIIKIAMIRIMERMDELEMRSKMILQVHDELIFESPRDELERMSSIVEELMPASLSLGCAVGGRTQDWRHVGGLGVRVGHSTQSLRCIRYV